jgi:hypothetical protein
MCVVCAGRVVGAAHAGGDGRDDRTADPWHLSSISAESFGEEQEQRDEGEVTGAAASARRRQLAEEEREWEAELWPPPEEALAALAPRAGRCALLRALRRHCCSAGTATAAAAVARGYGLGPEAWERSARLVGLGLSAAEGAGELEHALDLLRIAHHPALRLEPDHHCGPGGADEVVAEPQPPPPLPPPVAASADGDAAAAAAAAGAGHGSAAAMAAMAAVPLGDGGAAGEGERAGQGGPPEPAGAAGGALLREHRLVRGHGIWGRVGVWECAFFQLFGRETRARAADLYGKRTGEMEQYERAQQQQVEQNIAVRCVSALGPMLGRLEVPAEVPAALLEKLRMLSVLTDEGHAVASAALREMIEVSRPASQPASLGHPPRPACRLPPVPPTPTSWLAGWRLRWAEMAAVAVARARRRSWRPLAASVTGWSEGSRGHWRPSSWPRTGTTPCTAHRPPPTTAAAAAAAPTHDLATSHSERTRLPFLPSWRGRAKVRLGVRGAWA